jgi:hypothetical protein
MALRHGPGAKLLDAILKTGDWFAINSTTEQIHNRWLFVMAAVGGKLYDQFKITWDFIWTLYERGLPYGIHQQAIYHIGKNQCRLNFTDHNTFHTLQRIGTMLFERIYEHEHAVEHFMRSNSISKLEQLLDLNMVQYPIHIDRKPLHVVPLSIPHFHSQFTLPGFPQNNSLYEPHYLDNTGFSHPPSPSSLPNLVSDSDSLPSKNHSPAINRPLPTPSAPQISDVYDAFTDDELHYPPSPEHSPQPPQPTPQPSLPSALTQNLSSCEFTFNMAQIPRHPVPPPSSLRTRI